MRVNINPLIKSYGTFTDPAAKAESMGLQADARVVIACPDLWSGQAMTTH